MYTISKRKLLKKSGIYLVTDRNALSPGASGIIRQLRSSLDAGVDIVQYRDREAGDRELFKTGKKIKALAKTKKALFIVNNRVDMALALGADGVHLGQDDMPVEAARKILGSKKIIGISTHSVQEMRKAAKKAVDYISVGPVFRTPTKPGYKATGLGLVRKAAKELKMPFVAIGGIDESNIKDVLDAGAKRIAVARAILSSNKPFKAARGLVEKIEHF